ncbi:hypothetical protein JCM6882_009701 [Rhodosporidiobolus microsporus]
MSSAITGKCCVCGTSTPQRCSACGSAGFNLFFCSREHQKLVYSVHKKVCGERAKPFRFPPLSPMEVEIAKSHMSIRSQTLMLEEQLKELVSDSPATFPSLIDSLAEGGTTSRPPSEVAMLTATIRNTVGCHRQDRYGYWIFHCDQKLFPIDLYDPCLNDATFAYKFALAASTSPARPYSSFFPVEEAWYTKLHHHAMIFLALRYRNHEHLLQHGEHSEQLNDWMLKSSQGLVDVLQELINRDRPLAHALETWLEALTRGTRVSVQHVDNASLNALELHLPFVSPTVKPSNSPPLTRPRTAA